MYMEDHAFIATLSKCEKCLTILQENKRKRAAGLMEETIIHTREAAAKTAEQIVKTIRAEVDELYLIDFKEVTA